MSQEQKDLLTEFRQYEIQFYNTPVCNRTNKKQLYIHTNGTIDKDINHYICINTSILKHRYIGDKIVVEESEVPHHFCCGASWCDGPIGTHSEIEFQQWLVDNPTWTVKIV